MAERVPRLPRAIGPPPPPLNCAGKIGMLKRLKWKLHPSAFKRIYTGAIRPKMEYACTVWSGRPTSKLVDLQRTFCRRHNIQLPSLQKRFDYFTIALFFKVRIHQAPNSLYKLLPPPSSFSGYTSLPALPSRHCLGLQPRVLCSVYIAINPWPRPLIFY